jgi:hypothetical protein
MEDFQMFRGLQQNPRQTTLFQNHHHLHELRQTECCLNQERGKNLVQNQLLCVDPISLLILGIFSF